MRFAIFTHVEHLKREGQFYAYAPYVREMNLWLQQVEEVEVLAPSTNRGRGDEETKGLGDNRISYEHSRLTFTEVPSFNFLNFSSTVSSLFKIPFVFYSIVTAMGRAEYIHLRCPGNVGLLACVAQIFFPSKPKTAKYAGNWDPEARQPWTYRLQKWILSNTFLTRNIQVLVYGKWPEQTTNIKSFFTASFSEREILQVKEEHFKEPFIFLFVGNLVEGKRPLEAVKLVEELNLRLKGSTDPEIRTNSSFASLEIYGDGSEKEKLETYVREKQLEKLVFFKGNRPLEELKRAYQKTHFVILPSKSEGWPKAIAEGMFFGCIPIATPVSCVPWMLDQGNRGILLTNNANSQKLKAKGSLERIVGNGQWTKGVDKISGLMKDQKEMQRMSEEAKQWSQQYTLEKFEAAIHGVLMKSNQKASRSKNPDTFSGSH